MLTDHSYESTSSRQRLATRLDLSRLQSSRRSSLYLFTWMVFDILHRNKSFISNWHVEVMAYHLEQVIAGLEKRLLITVPPRHLKTICASVALPAFLLGHNPSTKIIIASYGYDLATTKILSDLKVVMAADSYRTMFPQTQVTASGSEIKTSAGGGVKATSVGGAITGHGADYIIIDDLMKAADVDSLIERERAKDFVRGSLLSRFDSKQDGRVIAIQQRLHEDDVAAMMIESGSYKHLNLPAIAEQDEEIPIGPGRLHYRRRGDVLFPQSQPLDVLTIARKEHGERFFQSQYQQNPVNPNGNRIRWDEAFGTYDFMPALDEFHLIVQSWDMGLSADITSDFSACVTAGLINRDWYVLNVYRERLDYGDLKKRVLFMKQQWRADRVVIEKAALGRSMLLELRREERLGADLVPIQPIIAKELRFETAVARLYDGTYLLPNNATWLAELKHECLAFPGGKNDDMVDALSQFLNYQGTRRGLSDTRNEQRPSGRRRRM